MAVLTLEKATAIIHVAFDKAKQLKAKPLTVAVLDAGGHLVALQRQDGASMLRPEVAIGKAWGAVALGKASRAIGVDARERPLFVSALNTLAQGKMIPVPGGVLVRDKDARIIGAVGISGDLSDIDEQCAITGIQAASLVADAGAD